MSSYKNFQNENMKYSKNESRTNIYNPHFNPTVNAKGINELDSFARNLHKYIDFVSWGRWFP